MKRFLLLLVAGLCAALSLAAEPFGANVGRLTEEEADLIHAFRANPHPYRAVLYGNGRPRRGPTRYLGPRDVIDVTVSGGKIVFNGKRRPYQPASIRLARGEVREMVFVREGRTSSETTVRVAYLPDGLHFDIPNTYREGQALPRAFIVLPEAPGWKTGEPFLWKGHLDSSRSASEAEDVTFQIRYASQE